MILQVCSVFDSAAGLYGRPFFVAATAVAVRSFSDEVNNSAPENGFYRHPEDYTLYRLCEFDESRGVFDSLSGGPELLARGKDLAAPK